MSNIWFTSDTHYYHKNIVRGTSKWDTKEGEVQRVRDFDTVEEHNEALVKGINKHVKHDDVLYHLGDWSFGGIDKIWNFRKQLNCKNIHLILGNHDHHIENNKRITMSKDEFSQHDYLLAHDVIGSTAYVDLEDLFSSVQHYKEISVHGYRIILCHFGMRVWNKSHHGAIHLYGHSHDTLPPHGKSMDVGVDVAKRMLGEYRPFSWSEIQTIMARRDIAVIDHHNSGTN